MTLESSVLGSGHRNMSVYVIPGLYGSVCEDKRGGGSVAGQNEICWRQEAQQ